MLRRARVLAAGFVVGLCGLAGPAAMGANTVTIDLMASGPRPAAVTVAAGTTIVFRNADRTFVHEVASKSTNWAFNSGPLAPGQTYSPGTLTRPGEYDYQGANLDTFSGKIVLPAPSPPPSSGPPSRSAGATPAATRSSTATPAVASPTPSTPAAPGPGGPPAPPLAGGFGALPSTSPTPGGSPQVAASQSGATAASDSAQPAGGATTVAVGPGRLPEPPTGRRYGLPAALAVVGVAGVASLLVRLLLTVPTGRAPRSGPEHW